MDTRENRLKGYSKFLSYVLRHKPDVIGLELDGGGWADIDELLRKAEDHRRARGLNREVLEEIVATNNKKRFAVSDDGRRIRARQGHSIEVDLGDEPREPPERLFHGTPQQFVEPIRREGLRKMSRHAVHLSLDHATAVNVGSRRGHPVVIKVRALAMHADGHAFHLTENSVWYTDHVPPDYLIWPGDPDY